MRSFVCLIFFLISFSGFAATFKVMQYNVENFFDTKHDEGTDDYTYLPLSVKKNLPGHQEKCESLGKPHKYDCLNLDWNESILRKKIAQISRVIKSYNPDVVMMEEVENLNVLNLIKQQELEKDGFKYTALVEGDDSRGISIGLISKYPVESFKHHSVFYNGKKLNTRGITEFKINAQGTSVILFGNHWPSQANPVGQRIESAKVLDRVSSSRSASLIVALGDFNVIPHDSPYPYILLSGFTDAELEARKINTNLHPGTHYYRGGWTSLDKIFVHRNSLSKADYASFKMIMNDFQMTTDPKTGAMMPNRFNFKTGDGFSDHLPIGIEFNL
jgi:endonuclease/exonuclease/phosphatase family metal-dependent hydrolase